MALFSTEWLIASLVACGGPTDEPVGTTDGSASIDVTGLKAEVSTAIATVVTVSFTADVQGALTVAFGVEGALDREAPVVSDGTSHTALLLGLPADTNVSYAVRVDGADGPTQTVLTGSLPAGVPATTTTGPRDGFVLTSRTTDFGDWILMLNGEGQVVWYHADTGGLSTFRARPSVDGSGIVYSRAIVAGGPSPDSALVRVSWDGETASEIAVPDLAHDFVEVADGTLVSLRYETREGIEGNDLVSVSATGEATQIWSAWDCWDPAIHIGDDPDHGWTHANALDLDEATGLYLVGLRNFATISAVDASARSCAWGFGGVGGTVDVEGAAFLHQHQFEWAGDRMLVFDNDGAPGTVSRTIEYSFDVAAGTATEVGVRRATPDLYSFIMGDVLPTESGGTVALWSVPGVIIDFDAAGAETWRLTFTDKGPLGFMTLLDTPYEQ